MSSLLPLVRTQPTMASPSASLMPRMPPSRVAPSYSASAVFLIAPSLVTMTTKCSGENSFTQSSDASFSPLERRRKEATDLPLAVRVPSGMS